MRFKSARRPALQIRPFSKASRPPAKGASVLEHVLLTGVHGPVVTLAGPAQGFGQFDETFIEAEVVPHGIFPALVGASEKGEFLLQVLIDFVESQFFGGDGLDGHDN